MTDDVNDLLDRARRATGARASVLGCLVALALPSTAAAQQPGDPSSSRPSPAAAPAAPQPGVPTPLQSAASAATEGPASHEVRIHDFAFDPAEITVAVGDTVVFTNDDAFVHSVTDDHREWDSAGLPKNRPWKLVVKGPVSYHCSFHPSMRGEVAVD
jgi:plastocyanin